MPRHTRTITRAYVRHYSDNGQTSAYVDWSDGSRTEASLSRLDVGPHHGPRFTFGTHMHALFARAKREGVTPTRERW